MMVTAENGSALQQGAYGFILCVCKGEKGDEVCITASV